MTRPSDEILMAYADGQLSAEEHARVAAYLETDPEARGVVAMFERSGHLARDAFITADRGRQDDLARLILGHQEQAAPDEAAGDDVGAPGAAARSDATVVPFKPKVKPASTRPISAARQITALAASLVLVVGGFIGVRMIEGDAERPETASALFRVGPVAQDSSLARLLEARASGQPEPLSASDDKRYDLIAVSTFRDKDGRACREFEAVTADAEERPVAMGVACRQGARDWLIEGAVHLAEPARSETGTFTPASGVAEDSAIEGLMRLLGASAALSRSDEQALLDAGWGAPSTNQRP